MICYIGSIFSLYCEILNLNGIRALFIQKICQIFYDILSNLFMIPPVSVGQPIVIRWSAVNPIDR